MRYIFYAKFLKPGVYFTLTAYLTCMLNNSVKVIQSYQSNKVMLNEENFTPL